MNRIIAVPKYFLFTWASVVSFGAALCGLLNYATQLIIARSLSVEDFAIVALNISALTMLLSPLNIFNLLFTKEAAYKFGSNSSNDEIYELFKYGLKNGAILFLFGLPCLFFLNFIFFDFISQYRLEWFWLLLIVGLSVIGNLTAAILQGCLVMALFFFLMLSGPSLKLGAVTLFLNNNADVSAVLQGLAVSAAGVAFIGCVFVFKKFKFAISVPTGSGLNFTSGSIIRVGVACVTFALFSNFDLFLVHALYSPEISGNYAAAIVLGKAALYVCSGIIVVGFPLVAGNPAHEEKTNRHTLHSAIMTVCFASLASIILYFFGDVIITTLYGKKFGLAEDFLFEYSLLMIPLSLILLLEHLLVAQNRLLLVWILFLSVPVIVLVCSQIVIPISQFVPFLIVVYSFIAAIMVYFLFIYKGSIGSSVKGV